MDNNDLEIFQLFPQLIFRTKLDFDKNKLVREIDKIRQHIDTESRSNIGGYQSPDITDKIINDLQLVETKNVLNKINFLLNSVTTELKLKPLKLTNKWFNINKNNAFNQTHTHPGSIISGTLHIDMSTDPQYKTELCFLNPTKQSDYLFNYLEEKHKHFVPQYRFSSFPGQLLMFPSYIEHYVTPNTSNYDRYSLAFNTWYKNFRT